MRYNKFVNFFFGIVLVTASVSPSLKDISICFSKKSYLFKNTIQKCQVNDNECMVNMLIKICNFK